MKTLIIAVLLTIAISYDVSAREQCNEEEEQIIALYEKNLNHGAPRGNSTMAYTRIMVGSTGIIYSVVSSATGLGIFSFVIFLVGSLDTYINSGYDEKLDKLKERLCT